MRVTDTLKDEHEVIRQVLRSGEAEVRYIEENGKVHRDILEKMVDFFGNFVYRCHHAKEEDHLFPSIKQVAREDTTALVSELLEEHETGHEHIRAVQEAVTGAAEDEQKAVEKVKSELKAYVQLIDEHITKENDRLFPAADSLLSASDDDHLEQAFERVESEKMGEGAHEKYHGIAEELSVD